MSASLLISAAASSCILGERAAFLSFDAFCFLKAAAALSACSWFMRLVCSLKALTFCKTAAASGRPYSLNSVSTWGDPPSSAVTTPNKDSNLANFASSLAAVKTASKASNHSPSVKFSLISLASFALGPRNSTIASSSSSALTSFLLLSLRPKSAREISTGIAFPASSRIGVPSLFFLVSNPWRLRMSNSCALVGTFPSARVSSIRVRYSSSKISF